MIKTKPSIIKKSENTIQNQIKGIILDKIKSGEYKVGDKIPSEREMSQVYHVSRTAVRNAILSLMNEGIVVRATGQGTFVKKEINYVKDNTDRTFNIAYIVCKKNDARNPIDQEPFYIEIFNGIQEEAIKHNYHLFFSYLDESNEKELKLFNELVKKVDGLIIEEVTDRNLLISLRESLIPVVTILPSVFEKNIDSIIVDLEEGAYHAVKYLTDIGHRKIGIINGPLELYTAEIRFEGYRKALEEAGIPFEEALVDGNEGWRNNNGYDAMKRLLDRNPDITAVFAANDWLAVGSMALIYERGLAIPDHISVVGFDDTILARNAIPPLTTVRIPKKELAQYAVKRLLDIINDKSLLPMKMVLNTELIENKSSKPLFVEA